MPGPVKPDSFKATLQRMTAARRQAQQLAQSLREDDAFRAFGEVLAGLNAHYQVAQCGLHITKGHACINRLLGKHCTVNKPCFFPPLTDHARLCYYKGEPAVFVSHPYNSLESDDLFDLQQFAELHDLHIEIHARSWYFPGRTLCIEFWNKKTRALMVADAKTEQEG